MRSISKFSLLVIVVLLLAICVPLVTLAVPASGAVSPDVAAAAPLNLADTKWVLSSLGGSLPLSGATITLQFNKDGSATGSDGCNRFRTTYTQKANSLTFKQPAASTMMMCPEPVMDQATAFMTALTDHHQLPRQQKDPGLLVGEEIVATFVTDSQSLAGTSWDVVNYNNGRQAVVGLLADTEISADFGERGDHRRCRLQSILRRLLRQRQRH